MQLRVNESMDEIFCLEKCRRYIERAIVCYLFVLCLEFSRACRGRHTGTCVGGRLELIRHVLKTF